MIQYFLVQSGPSQGPVEICLAGRVARGTALTASRALLPERLELGLVDHQQADEHEEAAQHHGGGDALRGVVLAVEIRLLGI